MTTAHPSPDSASTDPAGTDHAGTDPAGPARDPGHYVVSRTLAWEPGQYEPDGSLGTGGWTWRYDLAPDGGGTRVKLTYDWSAVPPALREEFGLPPFGPVFLEQSLETLHRALTGPPAG